MSATTGPPLVPPTTLHLGASTAPQHRKVTAPPGWISSMTPRVIANCGVRLREAGVLLSDPGGSRLLQAILQTERYH